MNYSSIDGEKSSILKRYLIKVWYLGTEFAGSQRQPNKRTVEGEIIQALKKAKYISDAQLNNFKAATRTDAGVHAKEAAYCFNTKEKFYVQKIESFFPRDIGISAWTEVNLEFHPRWEVIMKEYQYVYVLKENSNPSIELMNQALKNYEGTHNFRQFSKTDLSKKNKLTKITIKFASVKEIDNNERILLFTFRSKSFLWQQIRRTVSFMLKIGIGEANLEDLTKRFNPENFDDPTLRREKPCEAQGLILWRMDFPPNINFHIEKKSMKKRQEFFKNYERILIQKKKTISLFLK